jgi:hypothetical protein
MKFSIGCWLFASLFSASAFAGSFAIHFTADSGIAPRTRRLRTPVDLHYLTSCGTDFLLPRISMLL